MPFLQLIYSPKSNLGGWKEFILGSWRYIKHSVDCGTLRFQQLHPIFFSTADNWIKITPIHKPQREKMWHYHCKEKGFFKHRNVIETLIFIGSTTPPQHHFKKYFWRKKLLCAEINFILWLYNTLFVLINRFISFHSYIQLCLTRTSANPNNAKNV